MSAPDLHHRRSDHLTAPAVPGAEHLDHLDDVAVAILSHDGIVPVGVELLAQGLQALEAFLLQRVEEHDAYRFDVDGALVDR